MEKTISNEAKSLRPLVLSHENIQFHADASTNSFGSKPSNCIS